MYKLLRMTLLSLPLAGGVALAQSAPVDGPQGINPTGATGTTDTRTPTQKTASDIDSGNGSVPGDLVPGNGVRTAPLSNTAGRSLAGLKLRFPRHAPYMHYDLAVCRPGGDGAVRVGDGCQAVGLWVKDRRDLSGVGQVSDRSEDVPVMSPAVAGEDGQQGKDAGIGRAAEA